MSHPTRVRILMSMNTPHRRLSPSLFARETGLDVRHSAYHFTELADAGCIVLVETKQRRGATEHIYEPLAAALAWSSEWQNVKPQLKRGVLTSVLGGAVEALGSAIDNGTFEARDDSHLSWNTIEVDADGWGEMSSILDRGLKDLLRVEEQSRKRIRAGAASFLASYFMASFESPSKTEDPLVELPAESSLSPAAEPRATRDRRRAKRRAARLHQDEQLIMAKAMSHPTRVRILMSMNTPRRRLSPKMFAEETGLPVHHCAYHFGELEDTGCIALVATKRRRGATEHIYEPRKAAIQWTDEWKLLGPAVKQSVLASVMRGAVEALGQAIGDGTFEARDDSHLSWSTVEVDAEGWAELSRIFDRVLSELIEVDKKVLARLGEGAGGLVASYFMAGFESPRKITPLKD
jgi:hypothetical protein